MSADEFLGAGPEEILDVLRPKAKELADFDSTEARLLARGVVAHSTADTPSHFAQNSPQQPRRRFSRKTDRVFQQGRVAPFKTCLNQLCGFDI